MRGIKIGYYAAHEQFSADQLLELVQLAERKGFKGALSSDQLFPWNESQQPSDSIWDWLTTAMQATRLRFGIVNVAGKHYHPALVAQQVATLCANFPLSFWIAVGSSQYRGEQTQGTSATVKSESIQRLEECVDIMRELWRDKSVTHKGLIEVCEAKLDTLPNYIPQLFGAALTESDAHAVGSWADGLITTSRPPHELRKIIAAFHKGGGQGKPVYLKVQLSYDKTFSKALAGAYQYWEKNVAAPDFSADPSKPKAHRAATPDAGQQDMRSAVRVSDSLDQHLQWLSQDIEAGVCNFYLHNVNTEQQLFIEAFGDKVLPQFHKSWLDE